MEPNKLILTGKTEAHLREFIPSNKLVHIDILSDLILLKQDAELAGFNLQVLSGFRSFDHQLKIFNAKASGKRKLLDANDCELDFNSLNEEELLQAIMRWTAIPGASRHHWGTDIDVFDGNKLNAQDVQLNATESAPGGVFEKFHEWLSDKVANNQAYGFYRPYAEDLGGVSPERWHLSYAPLAKKYLETYSIELMSETIQSTDILLKDIILDNIETLYKQYITNVHHC